MAATVAEYKPVAGGSGSNRSSIGDGAAPQISLSAAASSEPLQNPVGSIPTPNSPTRLAIRTKFDR